MFSSMFCEVCSTYGFGDGSCRGCGIDYGSNQTVQVAVSFAIMIAVQASVAALVRSMVTIAVLAPAAVVFSVKRLW